MAAQKKASIPVIASDGAIAGDWLPARVTVGQVMPALDADTGGG